MCGRWFLNESIQVYDPESSLSASNLVVCQCHLEHFTPSSWIFCKNEQTNDGPYGKQVFNNTVREYEAGDPSTPFMTSEI
jgi:hypothetical protein